MARLGTPNNSLKHLAALQAELADMPPGSDRDAVEMKARQLEAAIQMNGWLRSPGLLPPT